MVITRSAHFSSATMWELLCLKNLSGRAAKGPVVGTTCADSSCGMFETGRVTAHWTAEEVAREQQLKDKAKTIHPDYIARSSFAEVAIALGVNATMACSEARKFA